MNSEVIKRKVDHLHDITHQEDIVTIKYTILTNSVYDLHTIHKNVYIINISTEPDEYTHYLLLLNQYDNIHLDIQPPTTTTNDIPYYCLYAIY